VVPFEPYLREIKDLGIQGTLSIELEYSPEPDQIEAWVTEAYRQTDRLMQAVGLRDERPC
jgi:sugar phosphate isomerase/epimerase